MQEKGAMLIATRTFFEACLNVREFDIGILAEAEKVSHVWRAGKLYKCPEMKNGADSRVAQRFDIL